MPGSEEPGICTSPCLNSGSPSEEERNDEEHQENREENFRDSSGRSGDARKAEQCSDEGDYQ